MHGLSPKEYFLESFFPFSPAFCRLRVESLAFGAFNFAQSQELGKSGEGGESKPRLKIWEIVHQEVSVKDCKCGLISSFSEKARILLI